MHVQRFSICLFLLEGQRSMVFKRVFFALLVMLNACGAMCSEFCGNIRAILRFPRMMEFCATVKWAAGKLDIGFLMSDDGAEFKSWATRDMPDAW